ncbi:MAG TPA: hypothetical protein VIP77_21745 [Jiangellaceae bacterium]
MSTPACARCGDPLAAELADTGVHVLCCDPSCDRWPCDGTHRPGQRVTASFSDFEPYPPRTPDTGGWCACCGDPIDSARGVCSPRCLARLARKHSPADYKPRKDRP